MLRARPSGNVVALPRRAPTTGRRLGKWARLPLRLLSVDRRPGVVILTYHRVGGGTPLEIDLPAPLFARQLQYLRRRYRIISLDALPELSDAASSRQDLLVLTFDDGYAEMQSVVLPLLQRYGVPATVYLPTAYLEEQRPFDWGNYQAEPEHRRPRPLTWAQVRDLQASGLVTIGAHTHTHLDLSAATAQAVQQEVALADKVLMRRLGLRPRHFAFPFGRSSAAARRIIDSRYETAAVVGWAKNPRDALDPRRLWRIPVSRSDGYWLFRFRLMTLAADVPATRRTLRAGL